MGVSRSQSKLSSLVTDEQNGKLAAALRDGIAAGTVRPDLDVEATATVLWAAMNGVLSLSWRTDRHQTHPMKVLDVLRSIVGDGLRTR